MLQIGLQRSYFHFIRPNMQYGMQCMPMSMDKWELASHWTRGGKTISYLSEVLGCKSLSQINRTIYLYKISQQFFAARIKESYTVQLYSCAYSDIWTLRRESSLLSSAVRIIFMCRVEGKSLCLYRSPFFSFLASFSFLGCRLMLLGL